MTVSMTEVVTLSDALSGRRIDVFTWRHSTEEISRSGLLIFVYHSVMRIMQGDNVFSLPSYYTRTDIKVIIYPAPVQTILISQSVLYVCRLCMYVPRVRIKQ